MKEMQQYIDKHFPKGGKADRYFMTLEQCIALINHCEQYGMNGKYEAFRMAFQYGFAKGMAYEKKSRPKLEAEERALRSLLDVCKDMEPYQINRITAFAEGYKVNKKKVNC